MIRVNIHTIKDAFNHHFDANVTNNLSIKVTGGKSTVRHQAQNFATQDTQHLSWTPHLTITAGHKKYSLVSKAITTPRWPLPAIGLVRKVNHKLSICNSTRYNRPLVKRITSPFISIYHDKYIRFDIEKPCPIATSCKPLCQSMVIRGALATDCITPKTPSRLPGYLIVELMELTQEQSEIS
ncbi:MAG: hypothetical protein ACI9RO_001171 [Alteromonas macleodii]|jgi:hypothetical protein